MTIDGMTVKEKREQIGLCLAKLRNNSRRSVSYISEADDTNSLNNCMYYIEQIEALTKDCTPEELQEILGGEFEKDYLNGMPMNVSGTQIPAYFLMDMAAMFIRNDFMKREHTKEAASAVLDRLASIREKTVMLDYNELFNPDNTLNPKILEFFNENARSDFYVNVNTVEGVRHLEIELRAVSEEGLYKNGEIYDSNVAHDTTIIQLYEEDKRKIDSLKQERLEKEKNEYLNIVKRYFKDGVVPRPEVLKDGLIDPNTDSRILSCLASIANSRYLSNFDNDNKFATSFVTRKCVEAIMSFEEVINVEQEKQRKEEEERRQREEQEAAEKNAAIDAARERYKGKSFLWRLVHRKENIANLELDQMTTEQISSLYVEQKGNSNSKK